MLFELIEQNRVSLRGAETQFHATRKLAQVPRSFIVTQHFHLSVHAARLELFRIKWYLKTGKFEEYAPEELTSTSFVQIISELNIDDQPVHTALALSEASSGVMPRLRGFCSKRSVTYSCSFAANSLTISRNAGRCRESAVISVASVSM